MDVFKKNNPMRQSILLLLLCTLFSPAFAGKTLDLTEALSAGYVTLRAEGTGGHTENSLSLKIENLHRKNWTLRIPAGFRFISQDSSEQDLLVVRDRTVELEKGKGRTVRLYAFCMQARHVSPRPGSAFLAASLVSGSLLELARHLDAHRYEDGEVQDAIWAVTDAHPLTHIGDPDLVLFVSQLLGKPLPGYTIDHHGQARPGEIAYRPEPAVVRGVFTYETDRDRPATFGLYDAQGERLLTGFEDQPQRAGRHKFTFRFEIRQIPAGTYYVRMVSQGEVLGELEVTF